MSSHVPQRRYDHIYDPVYTVSSHVDHERISKQLAVKRVEKVPDADNYFSEIPAKYAAHTYRLSSQKEVPNHVDTGYRPRPGHAQPSSSAQVSGKYRAQHFAMPHRPALSEPSASFLLAQSAEAKQKDVSGQEGVVREEDGPVTVQTQTRLRESEAQTDPYSPDFVVPEGEEPEVLSLAGLKFGQGLPVSMAEVEIIERARAKKAFLNTLPPITDEASFNLRKRMMEEQELADLHFRERKLQELHEAQLEALAAALEDRTRERERVAAIRVASVLEQKTNEKDERIAIIQRARLKALRKLKLAKQKEEANAVNEVEGHQSKSGSTLEIPPVSDALRFETLVPETLNGIEALEKSLDPSNFAPDTRHLKAHLAKHSLSQERKKRVLCLHLDRMDKLIKARKYGDASNQHQAPNVRSSEDEAKEGEDEESALPEWRRKVEKMVRPETPRIEDLENFHPEPTPVHQAVVLLQRLLRGRAIQSMMYEGKESRLELIKELRSVETIPNDPQIIDDKNQELYQSAAELAAREAIVGEVVSFALDFFAKELKRSKEQANIEAFIGEAEETRRWREMNEAGRRQRELAEREAREQVYSKVTLFHQHTAMSYFDDVLGDAIEAAASTKAKEVILQSIAGDASQPKDDKDSVNMDQLLCEVVFPHVVQQVAREQREQADRSYTNAAIQALESGLHGDGVDYNVVDVDEASVDD